MIMFGTCVKRVALCVLMFAAGKAFAMPSAGAAPQSAAPSAEISPGAPPSPDVCEARQESVTAALSVFLQRQNYGEAVEFVAENSALLTECKGVKRALSVGSAEGPIALEVINYARQLVILIVSTGSAESALAELVTTLQPVSAITCDAAMVQVSKLSDSLKETKNSANAAFKSLKRYIALRALATKKEDIDILTLLVNEGIKKSALLKNGLTALERLLNAAKDTRDRVCEQPVR